MTSPSLLQRAEAWNFDIDTFTNPYTPPSPLHRLPPWISRFFGYRKEPKEDVGNILAAFWSCLGAFCGLAVIAAAFNNTESIQRHHPPAMIASFGASAILEYNTLRSPLGQPRNALLGHTISAFVGVSITKLFQLLPDHEYEHVKWIAGAISCGTASALMLLTGTVHPPGGASAVLAATSPEITEMGWYFVPLVMYGTSLMLIVGLVVNNIHRRFPVYWWTPVDLRELQRMRREGDVEGDATPEKMANVLRDGDQSAGGAINVSAYEVNVPEDMVLSEEEVEVLERLKERLRKRGDVVEAVNEDSAPSSRSSADYTMAATGSMERSDSEKEILDLQKSDSEKGILDLQS